MHVCLPVSVEFVVLTFGDVPLAAVELPNAVSIIHVNTAVDLSGRIIFKQNKAENELT